MLGALHLSADYLEDQQKEARDRAAYWEARGYKFDPTYMAAFMMDQKVKDIERSKFWAAKGYKFDPAYMADFMMDQKVKDIDRARFWAAKGYKFDPTYMADFMMDQKVKDIERAKFWAARGYHFDPTYMADFMMDAEAAKTSPSYPPQSSESNIPVARPEVSKHSPPRAIPVFVTTATQGNADTPAVINLTPSTSTIPPALPVAQEVPPEVAPSAPPTPNYTAGMIQPLAKPVDDTKAHASTAKVTAGQ